MLTYHLHHAVRPRLILVFLAAGWLSWVGFRPGGTELGYDFGWFGVVRYWMVIAPFVLLLLTPLVGSAWDVRRLRADWTLASASRRSASLDGYRSFLAVFLVYAGFVVGGGVFLALRGEPTGTTFASLAVLTVVGPMVGGYTLLAAGYVAEALSSLAVTRITLVTIMIIFELLGQLPAALSVSGFLLTDTGVSGWNLTFADTSFVEVPAAPTGYLLIRCLLAVVATAAVLAVGGMWRTEADRSPAEPDLAPSSPNSALT